MSGVGPYARLFNALKAANLPDREAADAADVILGVKDDDIRGIRGDMKEMRTDIADLKSDVRLLKWMAGVGLAMSTAILLRLLLPGLSQ